jgi:hypothetical protein
MRRGRQKLRILNGLKIAAMIARAGSCFSGRSQGRSNYRDDVYI